MRLLGWYEPPSFRSADSRVRGCLLSVGVIVGGFVAATDDRVPLVAQLVCAIVVIPLGLVGVAWAFVPNHAVCRVCNTPNDVGQVHLDRVAEGSPGTGVILLRCPGCLSLYQRRLPGGPTIRISSRDARRRFGTSG